VSHELAGDAEGRADVATDVTGDKRETILILYQSYELPYLIPKLIVAALDIVQMPTDEAGDGMVSFDWQPFGHRASSGVTLTLSIWMQGTSLIGG
jgi:hypothetical protein